MTTTRRVFVLLPGIATLILLSSAALWFRGESARRTARPALSQLASRASSQRGELGAAGAYGHLPMAFEANQGQTGRRAKFLSRGSGYTVYLTSHEAVLALRRPSSSSRKFDPLLRAQNPEPQDAVFRMKPVGAQAAREVSGIEELPGKSNYFLGNDPSKWRRNIPTYAKVGYREIYPGIDLIYHGHQGQLEYDFVVAPGGDPKTIRLAFPGAERLKVDSQGDLVVEAQGAKVRFCKPVVYQPGEGSGLLRNPRAQFVEGHYVLHPSKQESRDSRVKVSVSQIEAGFEIAHYDASQPLVIDPVLVYSTYLGGSGADWGAGIAVDSAGNMYVTGRTQSTNFPTANPLQGAHGGSFEDAFVAKLDSSGSTLLYSTYLGGSQDDVGSAIAVDSAGNAYVTGSTFSTDFPTANPLQPRLGNCCMDDAFVAKLDSTGSTLVYSTYLGGADNDEASAIAVDGDGNAYVTGYTVSTNFPTANPLQPAKGGVDGSNSNAFVAKLNPAGSALVYSTYLGGSQSDVGSGIAVDSTDNVYLTGYTQSPDFPTANALQPMYGGFQDAFVAKLDSSGSTLLYSTYLGGSSVEFGNGVAVDSTGNLYVTGQTGSADFPTANPLQPVNGGGYDAFVAKLDVTGSTLLYSTYLGGSQFDGGFGIAVDSSGNAYVTGSTASTNFPTANPLQPANGGGYDAFVAKLDATGSTVLYSSYLGGSQEEEGYGIAVDSSGNAAYVTGYTLSTNFPTVNPLQPANGGNADAFVAKLVGLRASKCSVWQCPEAERGMLTSNPAAK